MAIRDLVGKVQDKIPVRTVLLSVSDKTGLDDFARDIVGLCPDVMFLSTGGTFKALLPALAIIGEQSRLVEVAEYTGFPEMDGGLVKTLHPKIHAGILGERGNTKHHAYLENDLSGARFIDMVVVNLYPFGKTVATPGVTFEKARGNIDIGGPSMVRGAAKNFPSCAVVTDPRDYMLILDDLRRNGGRTDFARRLELSKKAFAMTAEYDTAIAAYLAKQTAEGVRKNYDFAEDE